MKPNLSVVGILPLFFFCSSGCKKTDAYVEQRTASPISAPTIALLDLDGDGQLAAMEINYSARSLLRSDLDADGTLTLDEVRRRLTRMPSQRSTNPAVEAGRQEGVWGP